MASPFAAVVLDLMGGSLEVMVWSSAYERTQDLWYEGSLVEVVGKIRQRDDELSLHCDAAKLYQIEEAGGDHPSGGADSGSGRLQSRRYARAGRRRP